MFYPLVHDAWWIDGKRMRFPQPVEIHTSFVSRTPTPGRLQVLNLANEPWPFRLSNEKVLARAEEFDLILTWDAELLQRCPPAAERPRAVFFACGMSWITPEQRCSNASRDRQFVVTTICGGKDRLPGHQLRHRLWREQERIRMPRQFWNSSAYPLLSGQGSPMLPRDMEHKHLAFAGMFHIAIENCRLPNYFTEKLLDCFMSGVVPLYWGCPNLDRYFDPEGVFVVEDEQQIIDLCNRLTPEDYDQRRQAIKRNYQRALPYCEDFTIRMERAVFQSLFAEACCASG